MASSSSLITSSCLFHSKAKLFGRSPHSSSFLNIYYFAAHFTLTFAVTATTAERSFGRVFRRLKRYLCSTMRADQINDLTFMNIYTGDVLDASDVQSLESAKVQ